MLVSMMVSHFWHGTLPGLPKARSQLSGWLEPHQEGLETADSYAPAFSGKVEEGASLSSPHGV